MQTLKNIRLPQITPDPDQPRKTFDPDGINQLAASLEANGLLIPISVRPAGPGAYMIIAGERRFQAATKLGWQRIRCTVCDDISEQQAVILQFVENVQRRDLVPSEEAKALQRMLTAFTLPTLAMETGLSEDRIRLYLRMLDAPSDAIQLVDAGKMSVEVGARIAALPPEKRLAILKTIVGKGMGKAEALQLVQVAAEAKRPPSQQHMEFTVERNHEVIIKADAAVRAVGSELTELWNLARGDPEVLIEAIESQSERLEELFRQTAMEFTRLERLAARATAMKECACL